MTQGIKNCPCRIAYEKDILCITRGKASSEEERLTAFKRDGEDYEHPYIQHDWEVWQTAWNTRAEPEQLTGKDFDDEDKDVMKAIEKQIKINKALLQVGGEDE